MFFTRKNIFKNTILLFLALSFFFASFFTLFYSKHNLVSGVSERLFGENKKKLGTEVKKVLRTDEHIKTPEFVRAVYLSQCGAANSNIRRHIKKLINDTELNAVIVDIKDYTGTVSFPSTLSGANKGKGCVVKDMKKMLEDFHKDGIYVIGRITVFQDPLYASTHPDQAVQSKSKNTPWSDYKGLHFIDVGAKDFWKYIVRISHEAHQKYLFDELNYDYIRYPSDGPMYDALYTHSDYSKRADELEAFFKYLRHNVKIPDKAGHIPVISADLFGMASINFDDLTIGQILEKTLPYFDYVAPMVYPSHYPKFFLSLGNPNEHVYTVVNYSMKKAVQRTIAPRTKIPSLKYEKIKDEKGAWTGYYKKPIYDKNKLRPWLQDFDYGGIYDAKKVRAQIQAVYDAGINSWMLWDPANIYTTEALLSK